MRESRHSAGARRAPAARHARTASSTGRSGRLQMSGQRPRNGALDGLRAFAIVSVLLYHLGIGWLPSGHMGVVVFLVLTGFLVTSSVARGKPEEGAAVVPRLLGKRIARLWPPMAVMIAVVAALCVALNHVLLTKTRPDILPSLGFFDNISYILSNQSYFEALGAPSPLTHLWYVGVDMQFCLVWAPLAFLMVDSRGRSHPWGRYLALALALASAVLMGVLFDPTQDPSRVYYGPDTRAFALLLGAWLGLARPLGSEFSIFERVDFRGRRHETVSSSTFEIAGMAGLAAIIVIMVVVPGRSGLFYRGLMALVAVCATALVAALALDEGILSMVFSLRPLSWLGERSYSLYLWHYPIILLMGAQANTAPWWLKLLAALASLIAAALAFELVERPIAEGGLRRALSGFPATLADASALSKAGAALVALCCVIAIVGGFVVEDQDILPEETIANVGDAADAGMELPDVVAPDDSQAATAATYEQDPDDIPEGMIQLTAPLREVSSGMYDPVLIGDSVPSALRTIFPQACPNGLLDAYVARRVDQAHSVMEDYLSRGIVGHVVVYAVFSNVPATDAQLDELVELCGDEREVFLVNVHIPAVEQAQINDSLERCAERHGNVHLVDWNSIANAQGTAWLYDDGTHLKEPDGPNGYIELITQAIAYEFVDNGGNATKLEDALQIREVLAGIVGRIGIGDPELLGTSAETVTGGAEGQIDYHDANIDTGADLG